jgi:hypothetical protein
MNPLRHILHRVMEATGLDRRVDAPAVNAWLERRHARTFPILSARSGNALIAHALATRTPAAFGKIGDRECCALAAHLGLRQFYKYTWRAPTFGEADLQRQAGVFPSTPGTLRRFAELFLARLGAFDGLAVWHNPGESRILSRHAAQAKRFALESLEPYFFSAPWSAQLAGKRVLVVHPFAETIRAQYARRTALWPGHPAVLPAFELEVLRSPYGFSAPDFPDWCAMLRWLEQRIMASHQRAPLDVVLLGCGAAGPPLAAFAKQLGAIGIHTGGPTQLLFGIHGRRWDRLPQFQGFFNDAWLRPDAAGTVDQGGYW